jgi:ferredoxin
METRYFTITSQNLKKWLAELLKTAKLIAPVKENVVVFKEVESPDQIEFEAGNPRVSPKHILFPQAECLFSFEKQGEGISIAPSPLDFGGTILFGARPCDVRALMLLERVFGEGMRDKRILSRRESLTVVGLSCEKPEPSCFCESLSIDSDSGDGTDVFLRKEGKTFFVEIRTEKGENIKISDELFIPASKKSLKREKKTDLKTKKILDEKFSLEALAGLLESKWADGLWKELELQCVGCGLCTYLCPTCHCFDLADERRAHGGERFRTWDSCMYGDFALQASGENPRPGIRERIRQRYFHKFVYIYRKHGVPGCVACGRCLANCPQGIDIREVLYKITGNTP